METEGLSHPQAGAIPPAPAETPAPTGGTAPSPATIATPQQAPPPEGGAAPEDLEAKLQRLQQEAETARQQAALAQQQAERLKGTMSAKDRYWAQQQQALEADRQRIAQMQAQVDQRALAELPEDERLKYEVSRREEQYQQALQTYQTQTYNLQWQNRLRAIMFEYQQEGVPRDRLDTVVQSATSPMEAEQAMHYTVAQYWKEQVQAANQPAQPPTAPQVQQGPTAPRVTSHAAAAQSPEIAERLGALADRTAKENRDTTYEALTALEEWKP